MTSKVTQLFENPETMIEFIDRLGCSGIRHKRLKLVCVLSVDIISV
jgi:hypothetical protein